MIGPAQIEVVAAIAISVWAFVMNWAMRARQGYALSAAADFVLSLAAFDLIAIVYSSVFKQVVRDEVFRDDFVRLVVVFFVVTFGFWVTLFLGLEHRMTAGYDFPNKRYIGGHRPMGAFLTGWTLLAVFLGTHILAFIYE
jgi:hypothetical protein